MKELGTTRNLKEGCVLRAYRRGFGYARLTVVAVNDHFLAALSPEDLFLRVAEKDTLEAYFWQEGAFSFEFTLAVAGKAETSGFILIFSHTGDIRKREGRRCLRARIGIPIKYYPLSVNRQERRFYREDITFRRGTVVELTDREAVFTTPEELVPATLVRGHMPVGKSDLEFTGRITGCGALEGLNTYTIEYLGMHESERNRILDYVFTVYRE